MGAPTKEIKRDLIKTIRMTPLEWEAIRVASKQAGLRPTTYIVQCVSAMSQLHINYSPNE